MNFAPLALLGAAWLWLSQGPRRNPGPFFDPGSVLRTRGAETASERSLAAAQLRAKRGNEDRRTRAAKARREAEAAAKEQRRRELYEPVDAPDERVQWRKHDFMMRRAGDHWIRVPLRGGAGYGLHERYREAHTLEYQREAAKVQTEANRLRTEAKAVQDRAKAIGDEARRRYLDSVEKTVTELGGSRQKVHAFLPANARRWVEQTDVDVADIGDIDPFETRVREAARPLRRRKLPDVWQPGGEVVGLTTGAWGAALDRYLAEQVKRWQRIKQTDPERAGEAQYYLDVIKQHEDIKAKANTAARSEQNLIASLARKRLALDKKAATLRREATRAKPRKAAS